MNLSTLKLVVDSFLVSKSLRAKRRQLRSGVTAQIQKKKISKEPKGENPAKVITYSRFLPFHPFDLELE